jgi:hypothetical protein
MMLAWKPARSHRRWAEAAQAAFVAGTPPGAGSPAGPTPAAPFVLTRPKPSATLRTGADPDEPALPLHPSPRRERGRG